MDWLDLLAVQGTLKSLLQLLSTKKHTEILLHIIFIHFLLILNYFIAVYQIMSFLWLSLLFTLVFYDKISG